jgi:hypothetical protein
MVVFSICLGLGYPTLNRYDPRETGGLSDTRAYYTMVTQGPVAVLGHVRYRVLIPLMARPVYRIFRSRTGTWEPVFFGLLVVNAFFTATTARLIVAIGRVLFRAEYIALLGACLYLLNFEVSNVRLSGMIDSAEGCLLLAIIWSLLFRRAWLLPVWGLLGALGKETFVPFSFVLTGVWWLVSYRAKQWKPAETCLILSTGIAALAGVVMIQLQISGNLLWPWEFATSLYANVGHLAALRANIVDRNLFYGFAWLLPVGIFRLNHFPKSWTIACAATALVDFLLSAWYGAMPGTAARALFSIAGPLLSLSAAEYLIGPPETAREPTVGNL